MTEEFGWNVFGVAVAVLGIVIAYAIHQKNKKPTSTPKTDGH